MKRRGDEDWRRIPFPGFPSHYEVSNFGNCRKLPYVDRSGKRRVGGEIASVDRYYWLDTGRKEWFPFAALVLLAFVGECPEGCYLDDDRTNNRPENLAWGTDQDNHNDAVRNGISFVSYGHLGKRHSLSTRKLLSAQRMGVPTGRVMSAAHKKAVWAGYRRVFPKKPASAQAICFCGCGGLASPGKRFIWGHFGRNTFRRIAVERIGKRRAW